MASDKIEWTPEQESAIKAARDWAKAKKGPQVFHIQGFAGTGKTTLAKEIAANMKGEIYFGAFTGKAASVMRRKGCDNASTLHSLIYRPKKNKYGAPEFELNHGSFIAGAKLVIVDEVSMVDETLGRDLLSFNKKVLVLGDPAQLPPIKGTGFFNTDAPEVMLREVHRQARDNPIIRMSMQIREGKELEPGFYGDSRVITHKMIKEEGAYLTPQAADQIIVGLNRTRTAYNQRMRKLLRADGKLPDGGPLPVAGDKLVCLRNDHKISILNGTLWRVEEVKTDVNTMITLCVKSLDDENDTNIREVRVREEFFIGGEGAIPWQELRGTQQFTYGYALTCHKSQGSQWDNIIIFDEARSFGEDAIRWRYTAITRAAKQVTVVQ